MSAAATNRPIVQGTADMESPVGPRSIVAVTPDWVKRTAGNQDWKGNQELRMESGAEGSRTLDLCSAIAALSQLSYRPRTHSLCRPRVTRQGGPRSPALKQDTGS